MVEAGLATLDEVQRALDVALRQEANSLGLLAEPLHSHSTGTRMGAPLAFSSTTTNLAGAVVLALRPTT